MQKRLLFLTAWILFVSAAHFSVGIRSHREHLVHIVFAGLYLIPIEMAALWWGLRGGLSAALSISGIYLVHMTTTWANQPMENANQVAAIGVFLLLGIVTGRFVDLQERERQVRIVEDARVQREAIIQSIASLGNVLRNKDESIREHCSRVSRLAVEIGRRRALSPESLQLLRLSALVHDVGKIGVRDDILFKPDELTPDERAQMERHPAIAAEILRPIHGTERIAEIVLSHHECPDGTGYPRGLAGEQIPLEARILRVADVFAALMEARPYKPSMMIGPVLAYMGGLAGTKLDRESVLELQALFDKGGVGNGCPMTEISP